MGISPSDPDLGLKISRLRNGPMNITLPQLQSIEGDLAFNYIYKTTDVLMPQLQTIGGNFRITNRDLLRNPPSSITNISLPTITICWWKF